MENYFCANSVEEQVDYLTDKVKDIITNKLDKASIVQETGNSTDVVMSQKAVTDAIANKGLDTLTNVNLTVGNTTVQYDTTDGIQINSIARFTGAAGNHDAMMELSLPVVGKDGIVIDKAADSEKIEVSGKNFVQKSNESYILYSTDGNGNQLTRDFSSGASPNSIVQYSDRGTVRTNDPIYYLDAANKKYVDDNIAALGKLYQHTYTFEAGTNNYVYCTTYKNSNTPMTAAEVINFFKSDPSVGKVVNVCVVNDGTTVGSGYFFDAGEGIDYTVIVLGSSANFIITADTNMTTNIIEL